MAHDVFVSYSHRDKATADAIVSAFEQAGTRCWIAPRDIAPSDPWASAIMEAIQHARVMVVVLSGASNASVQVVREVERALAFGLRIVPFRIEDIDPTGQMAYFLSTQHWLDALTPPMQRHIETLHATVARLLEGEPQAVWSSPVGTGRRGSSSSRSWYTRRGLLIGGTVASAVVAVAVGLAWLGGSGSDETTTTPATVTSAAGTIASPTTVPTTIPGATTALTTVETSTTTVAMAAAEMVWTQLPGETVFHEIGKLVLVDDSGSQAMASIESDGRCLFAVGRDDSGGDLDAAVWSSCSGHEWNRVPHDEATFGGAGDQEMRAVAPHAGAGFRLVAVGSDFDDSAVWIKNGTDIWTRVPHDETTFGNSRMESVTRLGFRGLVAAGSDHSGADSDAAVWTSVDGFTWTRVIADEGVFGGAGDQEIRSVVASDSTGRLIAVGMDGSDAAAWASDDGITWTRFTSAALGGRGNQVMNYVRSFAAGACFEAVGAEDSGGDWDAAEWTLCNTGTDWERLPHDESTMGGPGDQTWLMTWALATPRIALGSSGSAAAVWAWPDADESWTQVHGNTALFGDPESADQVTATGASRVMTSSTVFVVGHDEDNAIVWALNWDPTP